MNLGFQEDMGSVLAVPPGRVVRTWFCFARWGEMALQSTAAEIAGLTIEAIERARLFVWSHPDTRAQWPGPLS